MQIVNEIRLVPVRKIRPYHRNVRKNDETVRQLMELIPRTGFNVPLLLDRKNVIVKGHARWAAAIKLGMKELPCCYTDADEETIKLDRLADNKVQELTAWNTELLTGELASLSLGYECDLKALGFGAIESCTLPLPSPPQNGEQEFTHADTAATVDTDQDHYEKCVCNKCGNVMFIKI